MSGCFGYGMAKEKSQQPWSGDSEATVNASIAHVVLCCVAGQGITQVQGFNFSQVGMHGNLFLFGVLGYLHSQSARFGLNVAPVYTLSSRATRFLAIPCMMADLYKDNHWFGGLHLLSGLIPFTIAILGNLGNANDNRALGNLVVAANIISLGHYSLEHSLEWGCYTAGAAIFTYYLVPQTGPQIMYPLGLALMEYCAYRAFKVKLQRKKIILNFIIAVLLIVDPCGNR